MKHFFCLFTLIAACFMLHAQDLKILNIEEDTEGGIGVYPCGDRHEAMVQFVTSETFALEFRSNYDKELNLSVDSVAGKKTYTIIFVTQAPGVSYEGRRLSVMAPGFRDHTMTLNLRDKQKFVYNVSDPYSALRSPYFIYQESGNDQFYSGQYQRAKDTYQMIRVCPEYVLNKEAIDERIALCDSMIAWNAEALRLEQFAQYADATDMYHRMYRHNSSNKEISFKIGECRNKYNEDCENEFLLAEHYMDLNQLEAARACYQRVVDKKCSFRMAEATAALGNINKHDAKVNEHARCLFYEIGPNMPIGLTYAQCYNSSRRTSGYVTLHMNSSDIDLIMGKGSAKGSISGTWPSSMTDLTSEMFEDGTLNWSYDDKYEQNSERKMQPVNFDYEAALSFGWTIRTWQYIFIHFGLGYHGGGFYTFDGGEASKSISDWCDSHDFSPSAQEFNQWKDKLRYNCMKANYFNGGVGELGLIAKVWRLNAKVTYQYTYWFNKTGYEDFLDDHTGNVFFGLGFNW